MEHQASCFFETQIGAVFFACILSPSYYPKPGEKQGANTFFRIRYAELVLLGGLAPCSVPSKEIFKFKEGKNGTQRL